ncbi:EndoU domain-containing protein, partial [Rathayibacter toxicus]
GNHGVFAAAGDWLAHNWEYLAGAAMVIGGGALIATGIGGPVGGMLIAAGADVIIQKATTGSVNWTQTAITAATGGLGELAAGTRVAAAAGTGLRGAMATGAISGSVSQAANNAATYATNPGPHTLTGLLATTTEGALTGGALGAAGGAAGAALAHGAGAALNNIKSVLSTKTTHTATTALEDIHPTPQYVNLASTERTEHILDGELTDKGTWSGGHRAPGKPGKTPFPEDWSDEKIMHYISDIATDPTLALKPKNKTDIGNFTKEGLPARFIVEGERESVKIRVVIELAGEGIITAHPIK